MQALAAHLALTGVAAARGDLQGRRGLAAAALSAATAASLGAAYRVAKTAGDVYEQALRDELGPATATTSRN